MIEIWTETARFDTSQRLADQTRKILTKDWFSDIKILEIYQQINWEEYQQDVTIRTETLNTKSQEPPNQIERQNNENWNSTLPNTTE